MYVMPASALIIEARARNRVFEEVLRFNMGELMGSHLRSGDRAVQHPSSGLARAHIRNACSRAALAELPPGCQHPGLVGEVVLNAGAREMRTPIGRVSSIASLRLNGAALACFVQSGLNTICGTLRLSAQLAAMVGALRRAAVQQHHVGVLGAHLVERGPDRSVIVEVEAAGEGDCGPAGSSTSSRRGVLAARKSRLSIIAAVRCGGSPSSRHAVARSNAVWRSNRSAAWSRMSSKASRRSISVWPSAISRSSSTDLSLPSCSRCNRRCATSCVEVARDPVDGTVEDVDHRPETGFEVGLQPRFG